MVSSKAINRIGALAGTVVFTCAVSAFTPGFAHAATIDELKTNYQVALTNYTVVLDQQTENKREIRAAETEVREVTADLQKTEEVSSQAAVALYKDYDNNRDIVSMVLDSQTLTEAINKYDSYERIEAFYREKLLQTKEKKAELEQLVAQLEARKAEIANELEDAQKKMEKAEEALHDADHSDGAKYHQVQGNDSNCGATSFTVGVNILLHENRYKDNVKVWSGPGFNGDSTVNLGGKARVWLESEGLSDTIAVNDVIGDIHKTEQLRNELEQGHVVIISSGSGSIWQKADGTARPIGTFPYGHFIVFYYYKDGVYYANDSSGQTGEGAGCPYNEKQMQQWLDGRSNHFATVLSKISKDK